MAAIASPCINICVLDPSSGLCRGCGRSVDEIAAWTSFSEAERVRIMADLPKRLAKLPERADAGARTLR